MATATLTQDATQAQLDPTSSLEIKTENVEYRVYANVDTEGNVPSGGYELVSVNDFNKWEAARKEKNEKAGKGITTQLAIQQTIRKYRVSNVQGSLLQLISDQDETDNIANRGIAAKFSQKVSANMLEVDDKNQLVFQPVEGVFDSLDWLQEETTRRNLSPIEKVERDLKKNLANLSSDDMAKVQAMLQSLMASQQGS